MSPLPPERLMRPLCSEHGCPRQARLRGLCQRDYDRRARDGTLPAPAELGPTLPDLTALGLTYRQLDYWTRVGHLNADDPTPGSGRRRHWPQSEIAVAARMARLIAAGFTVPRAADLARAPVGVDLNLVDGVSLRVHDPVAS